MHHLSNYSLSSTYSWEESVFWETSYGTSQNSPDSTISLPSTPIMPTRSYDFRPTDEATKKFHYTTTAIVEEDPPYEVYHPWTPNDYATVAAAPVKPQRSPVPGVALPGSQDYQLDDISEPPLRPDPQNGVHKEHYDFEFTKNDGAFFKLKVECCSHHSHSWPETMPVKPFANPKTGKVRQVCYFEDCPSSFKRPYDLFRHFNTVHGKMSIPCDYRKCGSGIEKAFNRLDHARDHYREYHKEDLVKRCKKDESNAEKADKWRERQQQRDSKNGLWWRCTACLQRNPWDREMRKEEAWRCQENDCYKECELERKIWRLEGVDAVLLYLKLVPGRLPVTEPLDTNHSQPSRRNKRKLGRKIKSKSLVSSSAHPKQKAHILPKPVLCSRNSSKSLKRTESFRSFSERMRAANKEADITSMPAACGPTASTITADVTAPEKLSSYYHITSYEDVAPNTTTETIQAQAPSVPKTLRRSKGSIAMLEISAPCTALSHPTTKGCEFCLSGWCLNDRVTGCTLCNVDGCICETPPPSQTSQASLTLSAASLSIDENERSPKRRKTVHNFRLNTPVDNTPEYIDSSPSLETWNNSSPIHPSLLSLSARTPSETQESLYSSHSYVWASSPTHSSSVNNCSPAHSRLLSFGFEEFPLEEEKSGFEDELVMPSQFNDEWDAINYSSS